MNSVLFFMTSGIDRGMMCALWIGISALQWMYERVVLEYRMSLAKISKGYMGPFGGYFHATYK